jgi:hypothetical protein
MILQKSFTSFIRSGFNLSFSFLSLLTLVVFPKSESKQKHKTHDYSSLIWGKNYVFEPQNGGTQGHMTGMGKGIKPDDYIILQHGSKSYRYQVEEIDYYSDPSDMWTALLKQVLVD